MPGAGFSWCYLMPFLWQYHRLLHPQFIGVTPPGWHEIRYPRTIAAIRCCWPGDCRFCRKGPGLLRLYIKLHDSETGDLIAKALDRGIDNPNDQGFYTWANASSNQRDAERILTGWANILLNALNEAKKSAPILTPEPVQ